MKVFITGVSGFLGSALAETLAQAGHVISGSARRARDGRPDIPGVTRIVPHTLGDAVDGHWFAGVDVLIHAAHDFGANHAELNVAGTQSICRAGTLAGIRRQIFLSSYSARTDAVSEYGQVKYALETFFLKEGHTIVRPGVVVGRGGMFGRNLRTVLASPVVPLLDEGSDLLPVIAVRDFVRAMCTILESAPGGAYNLFNPELVSMRRLLDTVGQVSGRRLRYLRIRSSWAVSFLTLMDRCRIPLPSSADNLRALKVNQDCIHRSNLLDVIPDVSSLEGMLQAALPGDRR